jgi:hypothetical protein
MLGWIYLMFFFFLLMISDKHTWRRLIPFTLWQELIVHWVGPFLILGLDPRDDDTDNCTLFFHQPFLDFCWFLVNELVFIEDATQVLPWLSLSSNGMAESYSSLVRQSSWWSRKELHWNLHESFISTDLGVSLCDHGRSWPYESQSAMIHWLMMSGSMRMYAVM